MLQRHSLVNQKNNSANITISTRLLIFQITTSQRKLLNSEIECEINIFFFILIHKEKSNWWWGSYMSIRHMCIQGDTVTV